MNIYQFLNYDFLFDSHAHLGFEGYDIDREKVIQMAKEKGVEQIFDMSIDLESSKKSVGNSKNYPENVFSFVGIDPEILIPGSELFTSLDISDQWLEEQYKELKQLVIANKENIKGIGETGMDFYWLQKLEAAQAKSSRQNQESMFRMHLKLAGESNLPLSIHSRGAEADCLAIVKTYPNTTGIFHSYTGDYQTAKEILDAGWGLGVNGIVTFKNANSLRETYMKLIGKVSKDATPNDFYKKGIFFETDAPFLSPEGKRGVRNEPVNVLDVYQFLLKFLSNQI